MKVILEPTVTIVGQTHFIDHPEYKIPSDGTDAEKLGSFAAKGCYDSYGEKGRSNVENQKSILEHKHGSVMEHSHVSFFIEGITRACSLELNRHRPFNISQRSTRYTKEEDAAIVLEPYYAELFLKHNVSFNQETNVWEGKVTDNTPLMEFELLDTFLTECDNQFDTYKEQVELLIKLNPNNLSGFDLRKWARGKSRNVLPHALETRGTWTNNHRGIRWFIEARSNRHAESEIRRLAHHMYIAVKSIAPIYYEDFKIESVIDGIPEYVPQYSKV